MFLCATSAQKDKGTGEPYDLTPALFENELDEPIQLKNFEIELVSSIIRKDNSITITLHNNTLLFRLGPIDSGEQYTAVLETGVYTVTSLATEIARALNDATPCNAWRGWSCSVAGTTFTITFTVVSTPTVSSISLLSNSSFFISFGYSNFEYTPPTGNIGFYLQNYNVDGDGNTPVETTQQLDTDVNSARHNASYRGLDTGKETVEDVTTTSIGDICIFEGGGRIEYEIRPTEVLTGHNVYINPPGAGVYLTLEGNYYNTVYEGQDGFVQTEVLQEYDGQVAQQLNGLYVTATGNRADPRGPPYTFANRNMTFIADQISEEGNIITRIEKFRTTFNGNIIFNQSVEVDIPNRAFQIDPDDTTNAKAFSTLHFENQPRQDLALRVSIDPLITGSHTQNSDNITTANILVLGSASFNGTEIRYKLNSIGTMNNRTFGESAVFGSPQGRSPTGIYKTPVYKITEIDGNGQPLKVILLDTGEHIGTVGTKGSLVLNDPNTFEISVTGTATDEEIVQNLCSQVQPQASDIGNAGLTITPTKNFQFLPTEVGLVNDLIHNQVTGKQGNRLGDIVTLNPPANVDYSKDITVKLKPLDINNTAPDFIEFEVYQFQPQQASFGDEQSIDFTDPKLVDQNQVLMRAKPASWNSLTYNVGTAPANWTNAFVLGPDTRVKIKIEQKQVFQQEIKCSFSTDGGATYVQEIVLLKTGDEVDTFAVYEFTTKSRVFPLHPIFSVYPPGLRGATTSGFGLGLKGLMTDYSNKKFRQGDVIRQYDCNYLKNLDFMSSGANQPDIFDFPTNVVDNHRPQIMIKTSSQNLTVVPDGTALPLTAGEIEVSEVQPTNRANLGNLLNLESSYSAEPSFTSPVNFAGIGGATTLPFIPTIAVEITNLPLEGYVAKTFNVRDERIGVGGRYPIVGIIPSLEQSASTNPVIFFRYNTPYPQPVTCRLATKQFLYNLAFRLRDIETGSIIKGLQNNTELIFRIKPLNDEEKNNM